MAVQGMTDSLAGLELSNDKTADYKKLIEYGLDAKVADKLDEIYKVEITNINENYRISIHTDGFYASYK